MDDNKVVTIQLTSKYLKSHLVISWIFILVGLLLIITGSGPDKGNDGIVWGSLISLFGFLFLGITRVRIWWNHK